MSHVFAARALVPGMLARGSGYLLEHGLRGRPAGVAELDAIRGKELLVALAEHLAIQYGDRGIRVSVLCPQSVQTGMTTPGPSAARVDGVLQPPEVARTVIEAMEAERFLILSHPQVAEYMQRKASSRDRWITGMRRLRDKIDRRPGYGGTMLRKRFRPPTPQTRPALRPVPRGRCGPSAPARGRNGRPPSPNAALPMNRDLDNRFKQSQLRQSVARSLHEQHRNIDFREVLCAIAGRLSRWMQGKAEKAEPADTGQRCDRLRLRSHASAE